VGRVPHWELAWIYLGILGGGWLKRGHKKDLGGQGENLGGFGNWGRFPTLPFWGVGEKGFKPQEEGQRKEGQREFIVTPVRKTFSPQF